MQKAQARVFSVGQVARMCHVSRETIRRWVRKYGLPAYNTQRGFDIKVTETELRAFAERLNVYVDWDVADGW